MSTRVFTLSLTPAEEAVLTFLVNVDPHFGEPLKDIEDGYDAEDNPFASQYPYDALESLKIQWDTARLRSLLPPPVAQALLSPLAQALAAAKLEYVHEVRMQSFRQQLQVEADANFTKLRRRLRDDVQDTVGTLAPLTVEVPRVGTVRIYFSDSAETGIVVSVTVSRALAEPVCFGVHGIVAHYWVLALLYEQPLPGGDPFLFKDEPWAKGWLR
jgi:hypothetical protein